MNRKIGFLLSILMASGILALDAGAVEVVVYGLEAMPYSGVADGKPTGIAVDILTEATNYGAPKFIFKMDVPWVRAQEQVKNPGKELAAIIPFSRNAQRESQFKWVAELFPTQSRFYSFGRPNPIKSVDEIKNSTVGVVHGHAIIPALQKLGLTKIDEGAPNAEVNASKLSIKRYDVIADSDLICLFNWKKIGQKASDLQPGPTIGEVTHVFIATGLDFPEDVANSISQAIEKMRKNGKWQEIIDRWK